MRSLEVIFCHIPYHCVLQITNPYFFFQIFLSPARLRLPTNRLQWKVLVMRCRCSPRRRARIDLYKRGKQPALPACYAKCSRSEIEEKKKFFKTLPRSLHERVHRRARPGELPEDKIFVRKHHIYSYVVFVVVVCCRLLSKSSCPNHYTIDIKT